MLVQNFIQNRTTTSVAYSEFNNLLKEGEIKEVIISNGSMKGILQESRTGDNKKIVIANRVDPQIVNQLDKYDVKYWKIIESTFFKDIISWVLPVFIFFGLCMFL
jgi:cell division protease FtsH